MIAAALALALISEPAFATELEARQWRAIVLLEGDLATATTALAACEGKLTRCRRAPLELPTPPEPAPADRWVVEVDAGSVALVVALVLTVAGAAFGLGFAAGAP